MPFYRYSCRSCNTEFKILQGRDEASRAACPGCGRESRERLLPRVGIVYNGSGFYKTEYQAQGKPAAETAGSTCPAEK